MAKPMTALIILDGFGKNPQTEGNAIAQAKTPHLDALFAKYPNTSLNASGLAVGLPEGQMGNSEVGHLNIGAGRVVYQELTRITKAIQDGDFFKNPAFLDAMKAAKDNDKALHLFALCSDGGVHSHINHFLALVEMAKQQGLQKVYLHCFMDGRDVPPTSGKGFIEQVQKKLAELGVGKIATIIGRYYVMDRDKHWERVEEAWNMLVHGKGQRIADAEDALRAAYAEGETDEFLKPRILLDPEESVIRDGDGVFCFNFRADRGRELVRALTDPDFTGFDRGTMPDMAGVASMTSYESTLTAPVAFTKDNLDKTMGELVSSLGMKQLRIAETEKYAHVTYFFSGGREAPFENEDRILVESPRDVATYDLKPQMSAVEVTDKLIAAWNSGKYDFVVCNLANPDMVGHTGVMEAAIKACETVDACVARIEKAVMDKGGILCITADHGNVEKMVDEEGRPQTAHTLNQTPFLILEEGKSHPVKNGKLGDIMPTLLTLWGVPVPAEMTGDNLLV